MAYFRFVCFFKFYLINAISAKQTLLSNPILCPIVIFKTKLNQGDALSDLAKRNCWILFT